MNIHISKLWKLFIASLIFSLGLFLVGRVYIYDIGNYLSGRIIKDLVKKETDNQYNLRYENLVFDPHAKDITIKNLTLTPDTLQQKRDGSSHDYHINVGRLNISLESIISIYLSQKLIIKGVSIEDPTIRMIKKDSEKPVTLSFETGNLYELISDYLKIFKINYFNINNGEVDYNFIDSTAMQHYNVDNLQFEVKNFLVDSVFDQSKLFYSESIELIINDQKLLLPDSIHQLSFDKFILSTQDSVLTFENLRLKPRQESGYHIHGNRPQNLNLYNINVPELHLQGIDYLSAYNYNHLKINSIRVDSPNIVVDDETHTRNKAWVENDNSLPQLLTSLFYVIDVSHFKIQNAFLDFKISGEEKRQEFTSKRTDIELFNFHLDTLYTTTKEREVPFENINIEIRDNTYNLTDSLHQLALKRLKLNSRDSTLVIEDFHIYPYYFSRDSLKAKINLHVPRLALKGINYLEALDHDFLRIRQLNLQSPAIMVYPPFKRNENQPLNFSPTDLYSILKPHLYSLESDSFRIKKGRATIKNNISIRNFDLHSSSLTLDSTTYSWKNFSKGIKINLTGLNKTLPYGNLSVQNISTTGLKNYQVADLKLNNTKGENTRFALEVPQTKVYGIDLDSLFDAGKIQLDSFALERPFLKMKTGQQAPSNKLDNLTNQVNLLKGNINNGRIKYANAHGDSLNIKNINTQLTQSSPIRMQGLETSTIEFFRKSKGQKISISAMEIDELSGDMTLHNLNIIPYQNFRDSRINIEVPRLTINQFNQEKLLNDSIITGKKVTLEEPDISLETLSLFEKPNNNKPVTQSIHFPEIRINNGKLVGKSGDKRNPNKFTLNNINLSLNNFQYPQNKIGLLYSEDLIFNSGTFEINNGQNQQFHIAASDYDSNNGSLQLQNISFNNRNNGNKIFIETLNFNHLKVSHFLQDKVLEANELQIGNPVGRWVLDNSEDKKKANLPFKQLSIDKINLNRGDLILDLEGKKESIHFRNFHFDINQFSFDSTKNIAHFLKNTGAFSFSGKNWEKFLGQDSLYKLSAGRYSYNHAKNLLQLEDVQLIPKYDKKTFNKKLKYQQDWFQGKASTIMVHNLSLPDLVNDNVIHAGKIHISGGKFEIYRDKNLPLPEETEKPVLQKRLLSLDQAIQLDTLTFDGHINYKELPENSEQTANLNFTNLDAGIYNFYTRKEYSDKPLRITVDGELMDEGPFSANVRFDMDDPDYPMEFRGYVGKMDLTALNPLLKPSAHVMVKSGLAKSNVFHFQGNETRAYGSMKFNYDNLKVIILNPENLDKKGLSQSIQTFFANTFIIKKKNPRYFIPRKGDIYFARDSSKSVFNYWAKSILTGILSSIGGRSYEKEIKSLKENLNNQEN